ncbi:MAG: exodeoxyribonuclease VII small subunit [bacterium]|nr:exodeoxyribonuclease VII small subunit [bacterium]
MAAKSSKAAAQNQEAPEPLSFEGALEQLETTVGRLEEGEMPLEEALELFEKGVGLSRQCTETLEAAERRIEILVADREGADGEWASEPFDDAFEQDEDDDEDPDD